MSEERSRNHTPANAATWLPTPPPSAERLMRALSLQPPSSIGDNQLPEYFKHLERVINPSYRDPPLQRISLSLPQEALVPSSTGVEPLFLPDDENVDAEVLPDHRFVIFDAPRTSPAALIPAKRPLKIEGADDDDIEFMRGNFPACGVVDLGPPIPRRVKRRRLRIEPAASVQEVVSQRFERGDEDTPLREIEPIERGCQMCGCFCNTVGKAPRSSGAGSTTLSPRVLGDLLYVLLGSKETLLATITRAHPGVGSWADIAEVVGARREDFDRVRHAARGMQENLPGKKARGEF